MSKLYCKGFKMSDKKRIQKKLFEEIETTVDKQTGEIATTRRRQVYNVEKTPEFIMLFLKGISDYMTKTNLSSGQSKVLWAILGNYVTKNNYINLSAAIKEEIAIDIESTKRTVDAYIRDLIKKNLILKEYVNKSPKFLLNPEIFGKGNWADIKRLRYESKLEYDFEKKTALETKKVTSIMTDEDELKGVKVIDASEIQSEDGKQITQKLVIDKDN